MSKTITTEITSEWRCIEIKRDGVRGTLIVKMHLAESYAAHLDAFDPDDITLNVSVGQRLLHACRAIEKIINKHNNGELGIGEWPHALTMLRNDINWAKKRLDAFPEPKEQIVEIDEQGNVHNVGPEQFVNVNDTSNIPPKYQRVGDISVARELLKSSKKFFDFVCIHLLPNHIDRKEITEIAAALDKAEAALANDPGLVGVEELIKELEKTLSHLIGHTCTPGTWCGPCQAVVDIRIIIAELRGKKCPE